MLDDVLELAHIAGPGVGTQRPQRGAGEAGGLLLGAAVAAPIVIEEVVRQHRDVLGAVAQRRYTNRDHAQAVVQILTHHA